MTALLWSTIVPWMAPSCCWARVGWARPAVTTNARQPITKRLILDMCVLSWFGYSSEAEREEGSADRPRVRSASARPRLSRASGAGRRAFLDRQVAGMRIKPTGRAVIAYIRRRNGNAYMTAAQLETDEHPQRASPGSCHHRRPPCRSSVPLVQPTLRAPGPDQDRCRPDDRRGRSAALRQLRRAPRPHDLRRHLRGRQPALGRERLPQGRARRGPRPRRLDPALARRQLLLRLQLEGRHRPEGPASGAARARLERRRVQPLRHRRVPPLRRDDQRGALHLHQPRPRHHRRRPVLGRVHQRNAEHLLGRAAAQERARGALEREVLGARQRDRRALAARTQERRGVLEVRARSGEGDARASIRRSSSSRADPATTAADWMAWNRTVLQTLRNQIDYIAIHTYINNRDNDFERYLGGWTQTVERYIETTRGADPGGADAARTRGRSTSPTTSGTSGIAPATARSSRRSTTSRTRSRWACSSTPSSATPTSSRWRTWRRW